jgi:hypothetical protein
MQTFKGFYVGYGCDIEYIKLIDILNIKLNDNECEEIFDESSDDNNSDYETNYSKIINHLQKNPIYLANTKLQLTVLRYSTYKDTNDINDDDILVIGYFQYISKNVDYNANVAYVLSDILGNKKNWQKEFYEKFGIKLHFRVIESGL